jgi:hypothetical protein
MRPKPCRAWLVVSIAVRQEERPCRIHEIAVSRTAKTSLALVGRDADSRSHGPCSWIDTSPRPSYTRATGGSRSNGAKNNDPLR